MASHNVRFAPPSSGSPPQSISGGDGNNDVDNSGYSNDDYTYANTAIEQTLMQAGNTNNNNIIHNRRSSNASSQMSGSNAVETHAAIATPNNNSNNERYNTAIAANDGPSLAMALTQSIRHHSRMIDGEQTPNTAIKQGSVIQPIYDPYNDDDHVSLAPGVELNYEKEASDTLPPRQEKIAIVPALRDYIANAGVEDPSSKKVQRSAHNSSFIERKVLQQQGRVEDRLLNSNMDSSFTTRFTNNITNWFGIENEKKLEQQPSRSVRFAVDGVDESSNNNTTGNSNNGENAILPTNFAEFGRAPKFVIPPPTSFRTATRHPSHLPASPEFDDMESRLNAPRRILAARKRHRRNDSFLRLMVAILCLGLSLTFAIIYGEGKFGLAITNAAYERKVTNLYGSSALSNDENPIDKDAIVYPDWWESEKGIPDMEAMNIKFTPIIEYHVADVTSPRAPDRIETPFFWFVPRSGGNVIRTIMSRCLRLAEASEFGAGNDQPVLVIEENDDRRYINVDMTTSKGLARAKDLKLASSGVADVVISSDIHGVLEVFNNRNRARTFAVIRHPMERAISKYYSDLASDPEVAGMSLPQYVRSGGLRVENNYLTRYLSGQYGGKLNVYHLNLAREFLRRKFVVGLASDLPATANLFSHVYGWNNTAASLGLENVDLCYNSIFGALKDKPPPSVEEGSEGWKLLVAQNWFDLKIYEYAEHLFKEQVDQLKLTSSGAKTGGIIG